MNFSDPVIVSIVSAVSAIIIAYIVNVVAKRVQEKKAENEPKDRMEQMFDGYERLIKQKDLEDERKARLMAELEEELLITRKMVQKLESSLATTQQELELSRDENRELKSMLSRMRKEYKHKKGDKVENAEGEWYNDKGE